MPQKQPPAKTAVAREGEEASALFTLGGGTGALAAAWQLNSGNPQRSKTVARVIIFNAVIFSMEKPLLFIGTRIHEKVTRARSQRNG